MSCCDSMQTVVLFAGDDEWVSCIVHESAQQQERTCDADKDTEKSSIDQSAVKEQVNDTNETSTIKHNTKATSPNEEIILISKEHSEINKKMLFLHVHDQLANMWKPNCAVMQQLIKCFLTGDTASALARCYELSRLDYCNSLLYGLPSYFELYFKELKIELQKIVLNIGNLFSSTDSLIQLHWLPLSFHMECSPAIIREQPTIKLFRKRLKNFLSIQAYGKAVNSLASVGLLLLPNIQSLMRTNSGQSAGFIDLYKEAYMQICKLIHRDKQADKGRRIKTHTNCVLSESDEKNFSIFAS
ncbi:hypothetical protein HELRODRAFT_178070 [Helobdella robusta]|uniref:Uncharacterized protein n=1 Tax=Helobdella robusta TaxID=6412 RepID=T1FCP3_HELRO|nr:hypothetical protein HELRODRAFT_178070 [Helobdella robusta]ESN97626.1 hypothetical protein HELRODRAFT_178070 [Helobdella robusta]